jgi:hypothetical protein
MTNIIDLKKSYEELLRKLDDKQKQEIEPILRKMRQGLEMGIEPLVIAALLDSDEKIRLSHIKTLNKMLHNTLYSGFIADNQIYIVLGSEDPEINEAIRGTYLLCNMPKTYVGHVSNSRARFNRKCR